MTDTPSDVATGTLVAAHIHRAFELLKKQFSHEESAMMIRAMTDKLRRDDMNKFRENRG